MRIKSVLKILVVSALGFVSSNAMASNYWGLNLGLYEIGNSDVTSVYGRLGADINRNLSAEVRFGKGVAGSGVELDSLIGAYGIFGFRMAPTLYPYAALGFSKVEIGASDSDISIGFGVDFTMRSGMRLNIEQMTYVDNFGGISIGIKRTF